LISGGTTSSELEITVEERPNPYDLKSRVDSRDRETKQEPIISGFNRRTISEKTERLKVMKIEKD